ncbi:potassium channel family protein [Virgibacillus dokdonensis]|uniref:potassium channel family protein n=1 Tax=Virgibacillus dokdonensis TaxID=302167 RepID=UPI00098BBD0D|nr:potassium channel family protein [Virgibacillus dokdonensis]
MLAWLLIIAVTFVMGRSFIDFIHVGKMQTYIRRSGFSLEFFYMLLIIYAVVIVGFGLIYFVLSMQDIVLVENGALRQVSILDALGQAVYFSGVTMLTIGYGDITPVGIGKIIALMQALIGYILPTAFVLRLVQYQDQSRNQ